MGGNTVRRGGSRQPLLTRYLRRASATSLVPPREQQHEDAEEPQTDSGDAEAERAESRLRQDCDRLGPHDPSINARWRVADRRLGQYRVRWSRTYRWLREHVVRWYRFDRRNRLDRGLWWYGTTRWNRRLAPGVSGVGLADAAVPVTLVPVVVIGPVGGLTRWELVVGIADASRTRSSRRVPATIAVLGRRTITGVVVRIVGPIGVGTVARIRPV